MDMLPHGDIVDAPPLRDPAAGLTATLHEALKRQGERTVLLCSFQKEESVLIDELLRVSDGRTDVVRIVTIDTGVLFQETLRTWREFEERFGVKV
jgi:phosphoadenosine phosphosulfate reductase